MRLDKMKKEDLELLSYKDITNLILEESKNPLNTADIFKKINKIAPGIPKTPTKIAVPIFSPI